MNKEPEIWEIAVEKLREAVDQVMNGSTPKTEEVSLEELEKLWNDADAALAPLPRRRMSSR